MITVWATDPISTLPTGERGRMPMTTSSAWFSSATRTISSPTSTPDGLVDAVVDAGCGEPLVEVGEGLLVDEPLVDVGVAA